MNFAPHPKTATWLFLSGICLLLLSFSVTVVDETQQAIISSYGKVLRIVNPYRASDHFGSTRAGLTFRIPFVEQIQLVDKRVLSVSMDQQEVPTTDQLRLQVDAFARFRITNPARMYRTITNEDNLRAQMATNLGSALRNELGKRKFDELLTAERGEIMTNIQIALNNKAAKYGAQVIDVRIMRADLPKATLDSAFARMRSERNQEAVAIEAEGQKEAQIIRAQSQADAAKLYADSYGKDADFYDFYRAMQSYRYTFQNSQGANGEGKSNIVLSPHNDYLRKFETGR